MFDDIVSRLDIIHERTDRQTRRQQSPRLRTASRGN